MLDSEANEALVALMQTKQHLETQVLRALRAPDVGIDQLLLLRKKYLEFLDKLQDIEDRLEAHQHGTPEEWIAMWKGQT